MEMNEGATLDDLLDRLGVDKDSRELITVNGEQILDSTRSMADGDDVEVFPAVMGGSRPAYLVEGIRLFNEGDYFLSHETLEEYWIDAPSEVKDFYQGLIHLAVGLLHHERGNTNGALMQFNKAKRRLAPYTPETEGVDVAAILAFLEGALSPAGVTPQPPRL